MLRNNRCSCLRGRKTTPGVTDEGDVVANPAAAACDAAMAAAAAAAAVEIW